MAEHILQTNPPESGIIFRLRYDTNTHWMNSNIILKAGEIAIAAFPNTNAALPPRAVGIKVGDGTHYFDELPWIQAVAADVYSWAKSINKPTYAATEITGLAEYIAAHSSGGSGSSGSGNYQIVWDETSQKYILQQWDETEENWTNTSSEIDFSDILNRIDTIERWANGARTNLGNIYDPIGAIVYDEVINYINKLDVTDTAIAHQFVTAVSEVDGKIRVTRSILKASDITEGILGVANGGTGLSRLEDDEVMVGSRNGNITTKTFVTEIDNYNRDSFATVGAIIDYVALMTAGLTGAMHFVGEATIPIPLNSRTDPQIVGYSFRTAQMGDVILANDAQELVWTGTEWRLLGDEGSYAIKGSITNSDIAEDAGISQSKISGLEDSFNTKVDKIEGKQLSTNDYSIEDKDKLDNIEENAQANIIEHIFLNDEEILPSMVSGELKSIDLHFNGMTPEQEEKLEGIEKGAQVNVIEHIKLNGTEMPSDSTKTVNLELVEYTTEEKAKLASIEENAQENVIEKIIIDGEEQQTDNEKVLTITTNPHTEHINKIESIYINGKEYPPDTEKAVKITLNVLEGAVVPSSGNTTEEIPMDANKKLQFARIAKTGEIPDLIQPANTYIIFNCGTSTTVV